MLNTYVPVQYVHIYIYTQYIYICMHIIVFSYNIWYMYASLLHGRKYCFTISKIPRRVQLTGLVDGPSAAQRILAVCLCVCVSRLRTTSISPMPMCAEALFNNVTPWLRSQQGDCLEVMSGSGTGQVF